MASETKSLLGKNKNVHKVEKEPIGKSIAFISIGTLTMLYVIAEIGAALYIGSLTLLSDGFHNLSDVVSLIIAWWAQKAAKRDSDNFMSYGWARAEILGGLTNGCFLLSMSLYVALESIPRFIHPAPMESGMIFMIVASAGLFINIVGTIVFALTGMAHAHSHGGGGGHSHSGGGHSHGEEKKKSKKEKHGHSHGGDGADKKSKKEKHGHSHSDVSVTAIGINHDDDIHDISNNNNNNNNNNHGHSHGGSADDDHHDHDDHDHHDHSDEHHGHSHGEKKEKHGHSHGEGEKKEKKDKHGHGHSHDGEGEKKEKHGHGHSHGEGEKKEKKEKHGHGHSHGGDDSKTKKKKKNGFCGMDVNMFGVFIHFLGDAISSLFVLITGIIIHFTRGRWLDYIDPAVSLIIVAMIAATSIPLVKRCSLILLQKVPDDIDLEKIRNKILKVEGVISQHDLHVWQLVDGMTIASAHIGVEKGRDFQEIASKLRKVFHKEGIHSTSLQPEFITVDNQQLASNGSNFCVQNCVDDCDEEWCCKKSADRIKMRNLAYSNVVDINDI